MNDDLEVVAPGPDDEKPTLLPADKLIKVYIKIREARAERKEKWEQEDKELKEQIETVEAQLLEVCRQTGSESIKTAHGTAMRRVTTRYWTQDWEAMHEFIKENDALHLLEKRIAQTAMKEFLEEHPDKHPQGLSSNSEYSITVRKSTK